MSVHEIGESKNNKRIYAHMVLSAVAPQLARQPRLATLIREVAQSLTLTKPAVYFEHDMGRQIGYDEIVETAETDKIFYAKQLHKKSYTRFVKNHKAEPTQILSGLLLQDKNGDYELSELWLGKLFPPMPGTEDATPESNDFWKTHAVVYNGQHIITSTQTQNAPYELV